MKPTSNEQASRVNSPARVISSGSATRAEPKGDSLLLNADALMAYSATSPVARMVMKATMALIAYQSAMRQAA